MRNLLVAPKLESFKNGEFSKYTRTVIELSEEQDLDTLGLTTYTKQLIADYDAFRQVYKKNRGSVLSPELAMLDRRRDDGLKLVQRSIKLIADFSNDEGDRNHANSLYKVFSKHGKEIYNMAYNQQGGVMDDIIEEIDGDPQLIKAVKTLNQGKHYDQMVTAHKGFDAVFKERIKEQQQGQFELSITELRKQTTASLRELFDWIFILAKTKGISQFETYMGNLNALTEQYNLSVERRLSNGKTETDQDLDDDFDPNQGA